MAKIDTSLGVNVSIQSAPSQVSVGSVRPQADATKSNVEKLANVLQNFNPTLAKLANKEFERRNKAQFEEGVMKVNNMTLEDARKAHDQGFPDLYNGWARYGAKVQYAKNATNNFVDGFKQEYLQNRHDPNYNWREAFKQSSTNFFADKQGDKEFTSAYNESYTQLSKWLNVKEFEKQSDELKYTAETNAVYSIQNLPQTVMDKLEVEFFDNSGITDLNDKTYIPKKNEYIRNNIGRVFMEEFKNIKENRNASLSKSDFDKIVLTAAETHADQGGQMADAYISLIQNPRQDGTPPIIANPAFRDTAAAVIKKLKTASDGNKFALEYNMGRTSRYDNKDFKKLADSMFENAVKFNKANGLNDRQAYSKAINDLSSGLRVSRPIPRIKEMLESPIGRDPTNDNMVALDVYMQLDQQGLVGHYFKDNNANSLKWFFISEQVKNGVDPREAIKQVGSWEGKTVRKFETLNSNERASLVETTGITPNSSNMELTYNLATYFKNLLGVDGNWEDATNKYLNTYYEKLPNDTGYVSKNVLAEFEVPIGQWDQVKSVAIDALRAKYKNVPNFIAPEPSQAVPQIVDDTEVPTVRDTSGFKYDFESYDLKLNMEDGVVYFIPKGNDDFVSGDVPLVITDDKTGRTAFAQVPISYVIATHKDNVAKAQAEEARKQKLERERISKRRKRVNEATAAYFGVEDYGQ